MVRYIAKHGLDDDDYTPKSGTLRLATNSFRKEDVELLQLALNERFQILCNLHKEKQNPPSYRLYFPRTETEKITLLVKPCIVPSMMYKLGLNPDGTHKLN
jgi:hypothetical protein